MPVAESPGAPVPVAESPGAPVPVAEPLSTVSRDGRHRRPPDRRAPSAARSRRMLSGVVAAVFGRGVAALMPLALVPVTLPYLGAARYGLWMTVTAFTGMAAFADLGLGNGLLTKLAPCHSTGDTRRGRRYVSTAYAMLGALAGVGCLLLWSLSGLVDWAGLVNADPSAAGEAHAVVLVCLTAFLVNLPLALVVQVQYACQEVGRSSLWQAVGGLTAVPLVLGAIQLRLSPLVVIGATVCAPILTNLANSVWLYTRRLPGYAPRPGHVDRSVARELGRLGGVFVVLALLGAVATNIDALIVAHTLGLAAVTSYSVPARLCALLGMVVAVLNAPLWPATADALTHGDETWVRRTTRRMTVVSTSVMLTACALVVSTGDLLLSVGLPGGLPEVDRWLFAGLAGWWLLLALISPRFMVQNALGVLWPQVVGWLGYLALALPVKWYGATRVGLVAVPFVGVAGYLVTIVPAALVGYRLALRDRWPASAASARPAPGGPARPAASTPDPTSTGRPVTSPSGR
ncbi:oligosaccharide flippase family protein [Micromonospora sp. WMMA1923]|uniref:oligosaccharide flippase family protein n=1 Tax=Micromonospora sp. WMMA1923 TaxID=3404125 RepID=UPI003B9441D5